MRLGVITDIHNNFIALERVLDSLYKEKCDKIICCGDIIGIGPYPEETVQLMMKTENLIARVTVIIRTRQKCSIKAIFVAFAVALRQQGCHLKTTNLIFTTSIFDALQFSVCRFGLNQGIKRS